MAISTIVYYFSYTQWHPASLLTYITHDSFDASVLNGTLSSIIAYGVGMIQSFILNKTWTFKVKNGTFNQARRFFILNMMGLALTTAIIFAFVDMMNFNYMSAWIVAVLLVMIFNFAGNKYWTFSEESVETRQVR